LYNQNTKNFRNKIYDWSTHSLHESNLRENKIEENLTNRSGHNKRAKMNKSLNKSHKNFYEKMNGLENQRTHKMLQLMIDKENREISELKYHNANRKK